MENKMNNMKQAMFEMFGVGPDPESKTATPAPAAPAAPAPAHVEDVRENKPFKPMSAYRAPQPKRTSSYLAPGTVMVGTLHSEGDVEIAGDFKGDITTKGTVILHANIEGNLTVSSLNLSGCKLTGNVTADGTVAISQDSEIQGNVTAQDLHCSGRIVGDLNISEGVSLESTAHILGDITTGTLAMSRGAVVNGNIRTRQPDGE